MKTDLDKGELIRLKRLCEQLHVQDNLATADPMFAVEEYVRHYGIESARAEGLSWLYAGELVDPPEEGAEAYAESEGYEQTGYRDQWETVTLMFTRDAATAYIEHRAHDHRGQLRVFVASAHRCPELKLLRKFLEGLEIEAAELPRPPAITELRGAWAGLRDCQLEHEALGAADTASTGSVLEAIEVSLKQGRWLGVSGASLYRTEEDDPAVRARRGSWIPMKAEEGADDTPMQAAAGDLDDAAQKVYEALLDIPLSLFPEATRITGVKLVCPI